MTDTSSRPDRPDRPTKREFVAYLRVSDAKGREGESFHSPDMQRERIKRAVEFQDGTIVKECLDLGMTGRTTNRPGYQEALAWVMEEPTSRGFAVKDVTRLARNTKDVILDVQEKMLPAGAVFVSAEQMIDTSTGRGRKQLRDEASDAEAQSDIIGEIWTEVHDRRIARGQHPTGKVPYGYLSVAGALQPDPVQAPVVQQMYRSYLAGNGLREIARNLNRDIIPAPSGGEWSVSTVKHVLENGHAAGLLRFRGDLTKGAWEPLISLSTWDSFQAERARRTKIPQKSQAASWPLGGGLARCGLCGGPIVVNSSRGRSGMCLCSGYRNGSSCPGVFLMRVSLERSFTLYLSNHLEALGKRTAARIESQRSAAREQAERDLEQADRRLAEISTAKVSLAKDGLEIGLSVPEIKASVQEYDEESESLRAQRDDAQQIIDASVPLGDVYEQLITGGEGMSTSEWSRILAKVISRVELHPDRIVFVPRTGRSTTWKRSAKRTKLPETDTTDWDSSRLVMTPAVKE